MTEQQMEQVKEHINRYFIAVYGPAYVYRAPETFNNVLEQWMLAVASRDIHYAEKRMARIEEMAKG
jgi:hypothetical protein